MRGLLFGLGMVLALTVHAAANQFSNWAVLVVAGDDHAHSGAPSKVFDNARHDLVKDFTAIGFSPANIAQFSLDPDNGALPTGFSAIASTMWDLSSRAPGGCLIYFTSHGSPDGIVVNQQIIGPDKMAAMVNNSCGAKPAVIVMSACFSGQFVPVLAGDDRIVISAARADRTSFGCGELDQYTFFDDCFLRALPKASDFAGMGDLVQQCVKFREEQLHASPPSEPQVSIGPKVAFTLRWK